MKQQGGSSLYAKLWETELTLEAGAALMRRVYAGGLIYCCPHTATTNEANITPSWYCGRLHAGISDTGTIHTGHWSYGS